MIAEVCTWRRLTTAFLTACSLTTGAVSLWSETSLPAVKERWVELQTGNFAFFSNASPRTLRQVATDLEELRAVLAQLAGGGRPEPVPTYVFVFRSQRSFEPYKPLYQGRPAAVSGTFQPRPEANYITIDGSTREQASGIVFHEYVHHLLSERGANLPLWFEEGLSELYRTFTVVGNEAHIGKLIPGHLQLIRSRPRLSLPELFGVDRDSPTYNDPARKGMFYAQSWSLVHYLLLGDRRRQAQVARALAAVEKGFPHEQALAEALYADHEALTRELGDYLSRVSFPYVRQPVQVSPADEPKPRPMAQADVLYRLGDLLAGQEPIRPEAEEHFHAALQADPEHGPSLAGLGLLAEGRARWAEALALYERAARAAPKDALVLYRYGELLLERENEVEAARLVLARATALAPGFAPAWSALARALLADGEVGEEAVRAGETALSLMPARPDVAGTLLRIYLLAGCRDEAQALVERTLAFGARERARAWTTLLDNDLNRAGALVTGGHQAEALALVGQVESRLDRAASQERLRHRAAEVRAAIVDARLAESYRLAVARFNAGDEEGALELLNQVLAGAAVDSELAGAARRLALLIRQPPAATRAQPAPPAFPLVSEVETGQLNRLLAGNRYDEALQLLDGVKRRLGRAAPSWVDAKMAEIRRAVAHNRFVDQYNRAVALFNQGDHVGAAAVLEALLATALDRDQREDAQQLLEEARRETGER